ncbi:methylated-DNA--[protein]-cysteine S-methyltransferase [Bacillus sp. T33-2]|uniref:methylated-DNA--[protein]-cysteine S-methyltransferase n=1 Tax=Bacillus sp. T33-2 TaxID=2054168 RepID=UPI000C783780|nr:methylated-DNA--[protein]-cysteine S-methyltransferase [Bacillus sp. T33-2]PLR97505.1 cysteine methyltransferase [Bacillus sp. T33-2]
MTQIYSSIETAAGELFIVAEAGRISAIRLGEGAFLKHEGQQQITRQDDDLLLKECVKQLKGYFLGERKSFDLPIAQKGTPFQLEVWNQLLKIPYGDTKSYQDIAVQTGRPRAVRAVGQANKANKLPIIIPCHRVIGKNRSLTGYAGNRTEIKDILLSLEGAAFKPWAAKQNRMDD